MILSELKEIFYLAFLDLFQFDCRKVFTLSDGGIIHLDFIGKRFVDEDENCEKPILFIMPTLTGSSTTPTMINIAKEGKKRGYDICLINWRGLAGAKLTTPRSYTYHTFKDIEEPLK